MFQKLSIVFISAFLCSQVYAAQIFQSLTPESGQQEVMPFIGLIAGHLESKTTTGVEATMASAVLGGSYFYGIATGHAIGLQLTYTSQSTTTKGAGPDFTQKYKGLNNPMIGYKGLYELESMSIYSQVGYSLNTTKSKYNTDDKEGNVAKGRNSLTLDIGAYTPVTPEFTVGGHISYTNLADGETTNTSAAFGDEKYNLTAGGSMTFEAFMEFPNIEWHPNVAVGLRKEYTSKSTDASGNVTESIGLNYSVLTGALRYDIQPNFSFIPQASLTTAQENSFVKNYSVLAVAASARILF